MRFGDAGASGRDASYTTQTSDPVTDASRPAPGGPWDFLPNFLLAHKEVYGPSGSLVGNTVGPDFLKLGAIVVGVFWIGKKALVK